jgi:hypothetical protein
MISTDMLLCTSDAVAAQSRRTHRTFNLCTARPPRAPPRRPRPRPTATAHAGAPQSRQNPPGGSCAGAQARARYRARAQHARAVRAHVLARVLRREKAEVERRGHEPRRAERDEPEQRQRGAARRREPELERAQRGDELCACLACAREQRDGGRRTRKDSAPSRANAASSGSLVARERASVLQHTTSSRPSSSASGGADATTMSGPTYAPERLHIETASTHKMCAGWLSERMCASQEARTRTQDARQIDEHPDE